MVEVRDLQKVIVSQREELKDFLTKLIEPSTTIDLVSNSQSECVVLSSNEGPMSYLTIQYSNIQKRWELHTENLFIKGSVYDLYYPIFQAIMDLLNSFNCPKQGIGFSL